MTLTPRRVAAAVAAVALAVVLPLRTGTEPPTPLPAVAPPPQETPGVRLAMHLDEPVGDATTLVWTAAFQAAWDTLSDSIGATDGLRLAPPAPAKDVWALAAGRLSPGVVAPGDLTVVAGPATDATWGEIGRSSDRPRPSGTPAPDRRDLVAFARLRASVRYGVPFAVQPKPLLWGRDRVPVRAYGILPSASGPDAERMRDQMRVHLPEGGSGDVAARGVVVLTGTDGSRVVLSARPPGPTLRATWADVSRVVRSTAPRELSVVDAVMIPRVAISAGRSYDELVGAAIEGIPDAWLAVVEQHVTLTVDERGADVDAEAVIVAVGALPLVLKIDGPFSLALLAPRSEQPYVLAWIGSAAALTGWGDPIGSPLTPVEAAPFAESWTLDRDASVKATVASARPTLAKSPGDAARFAGDVARVLAATELDVVADATGKAQIALRRGDERPTRATAPLRRDGARVVLTLREPAGAEEQRWRVERRDDRLVLHSVGGVETFVLRPR